MNSSSTDRTELHRKVKRLARLAAEADIKEGGTRNMRNSLAMMAWALRMRKDHGGCGVLRMNARGLNGPPVMICPVHGEFKGPEWIPRERD